MGLLTRLVTSVSVDVVWASLGKGAGTRRGGASEGMGTDL